ncbi:hypothetical protein JTE90_028333 [Oedothorax gibbosus]|uniref:Uncharacterized protein n=1 Tax=Oedothorax gibbosus TaxID=931172 RepID=A0AAV6V3K3_9ARAC|nr:hypothetical protein JTE90_028333 [Oedothorax gibbosus]
MYFTHLHTQQSHHNCVWKGPLQLHDALNSTLKPFQKQQQPLHTHTMQQDFNEKDPLLYTRAVKKRDQAAQTTPRVLRHHVGLFAYTRAGEVGSRATVHSQHESILKTGDCNKLGKKVLVFYLW